MIKVGLNTAKLYKGNYKPATFYKGNIKYASYKTVRTGGSEFTVNNTYNDKLKPTLFANVLQQSVVYYQCEAVSFQTDLPGILNPVPIYGNITSGLYPLFLRDGIYTATLPDMYSVGEKRDTIIIDTNGGTGRIKKLCGCHTLEAGLSFTAWQGENGSYVDFNISDISGNANPLGNFTLGQIAQSDTGLDNSDKIVAVNGENTVRWYPKYTDLGLTSACDKATADTALQTALAGIENKKFTYLLNEPTYTSVILVKRKTYTLNNSPVFTPVTSYNENLLVLPQGVEQAAGGMTAVFTAENNVTVSGTNLYDNAIKLLVLTHKVIKDGQLSIKLNGADNKLSLYLTHTENGLDVVYRTSGDAVTCNVQKGDTVTVTLEVNATTRTLNGITVIPQLYYSTAVPQETAPNLVAPNSANGTTGKNKILLTHFLNTANWYSTGYSAYRYNISGLKSGVTYTLSYDYTVLPENLYLDRSQNGGVSWQRTALTAQSLINKSYTFTLSKNELCGISIASKSQIPRITAMQIEAGNTATDYEDYICYSPSTDYPQKILPSGAYNIVSQGKTTIGKTVSDISNLTIYGVETNIDNYNRIIVDETGDKHYCLVDTLEYAEKAGAENYKITRYINGSLTDNTKPIYFQENAIRQLPSAGFSGLTLNDDLNSHPVLTKVYFEKRSDRATPIIDVEIKVTGDTV